MEISRVLLGILALAGLGGCAVTPPTGPSVMVLPGANKTYSAFQSDDYACRGIAAQSIGYGAPAQVANQNAVATAAVGTAVGAAAGAAIGAASGNAGAGAAIGAGSGLLVGSAVGANNAQASSEDLQQHYDVTYIQCMVSKGNKLPDNQPVGAIAYPAPGYPYYAYPPPYAYYPDYGYGYLFPSVTFYRWGGGWHGGWRGGWGGGWHGGWHRR